MCLCLSHISYHSSKKPSLYGVESTLYSIPDFTDGSIGTLLPFCNLPALGTLVHDTTFEFHLSCFLFYLIENPIVHVCIYQDVSEAIDCCTVRSHILHTQSDEAAKRETVVHLTLLSHHRSGHTKYAEVLS